MHTEATRRGTSFVDPINFHATLFLILVHSGLYTKLGATMFMKKQTHTFVENENKKKKRRKKDEKEILYVTF